MISSLISTFFTEHHFFELYTWVDSGKEAENAFFSWLIIFSFTRHQFFVQRCWNLFQHVIDFAWLGPECSAKVIVFYLICKWELQKQDLLWTSANACITHKNTFSAPFGIFYVKTKIWVQIFQKICYKTPQWGAVHLHTTISKWELP